MTTMKTPRAKKAAVARFKRNSSRSGQRVVTLFPIQSFSYFEFFRRVPTCVRAGNYLQIVVRRKRNVKMEADLRHGRFFGFSFRRDKLLVTMPITGASHRCRLKEILRVVKQRLGVEDILEDANCFFVRDCL